MIRAMSVSGTVALFAVMLGTACSSSDDPGEGFGGNGGNGGQNPGGMGGVLGTGGGLGTGGDGGVGGGGNSGVGGGGNSGVGGGGNSGVGGGGNSGVGGDAGTAGDAGTGGTTGSAGDAGTAGMSGTAGMAGTGGGGSCCRPADPNCICRDPAPPGMLSGARGPFMTMSYDIPTAGCVYYPTNAMAPFSAVAVSDGFLGAGGCVGAQTSGWGPLLASYGIVTMIIHTTGADQPPVRGQKLLAGIAAFKAENTKSGSPLFGKLAGRYGTSGFSMGGGGTTRATVTDKTLLSSVAIMPYSPDGAGVVTPTLVICGSSDGVAPCSAHGTPVYNEIPGSTPKMRIQVSSGHSGQPSAGSNMSGAWGLAFHKAYLDGDTRWVPVLNSAMAEQKANIQ